MDMNASTITFILFFQFTSSALTETAFKMMTSTTVGKVNITAFNTEQKGKPYSFRYDSRDHPYHAGQESRGQSDTVTRMSTSLTNNLTNNFSTDVLNVTKGHISSNNRHRSAGSSHFNVELENCTNRIVNYRVSDNKSSILWYFNAKELSTSWSPTSFCGLALSVPQGMVAVVETTTRNIYYNAVNITLFDDANVTLFTGCPCDLPTPFVTYSHLVTFRLTFIMENLERLSGFEMVANITSLPETSRPQLQITFYSSTSGKVTMQNWNDDRQPFVKSSVHLTAPNDYIIVLHVNRGRYACYNHYDYHDHLIFRTYNETLTYDLCVLRENTCNGLAFYSGLVFIEYISHQRLPQKDFIIAFDFYHISQLPVELTNDRWTCSVRDWPDMWQDSRCIFIFDCNDKEAESGCWQGDGTFKQGVFQVDGRCIAILNVNQTSTWNLESEWCQERGGQLVSLTTQKLKQRLPVLLHQLSDKCAMSAINLKQLPHVFLPEMYKRSLQWSDKTVAHINYRLEPAVLEHCFFTNKVSYASYFQFKIVSTICTQHLPITCRLCQLPGTARQHRDIHMPVIVTKQPAERLSQAEYIPCPANHFTHVFLACDENSACWSNNTGAPPSCSSPLRPLPPFFTCSGVQDSVPYTLVCDHQPDCKDGSDEDFCYFPPCDTTSHFYCDDKRCIHQTKLCNDWMDCHDGIDEEVCTQIKNGKPELDLEDLLIPNFQRFIVKDGRLIFTETSDMLTFSCPDSDFSCASLQKVCLPVFLRCNGMYDCPDHEDEAACDRYTCPGFYRCRKSQVCVHESHVCDRVYQCPQGDDEMLCGETCPQKCVCHGLAFICSDIFHAANYSNIRYLDVSGTSMTLAHLWNNTFLVHLTMVKCHLTSLREVKLPNLRILDISNNAITQLTSRLFAGLTKLEFLSISNNPLNHFLFQDVIEASPLKVLDMSHIQMSETDFGILSFFSQLTTLNLSGNSINHVTEQGFRENRQLRVLDLRQSPVTHFPREMFQSLGRLESLFSDNYKLCCPAVLPRGFNVLNCHAPFDEVSSCDDLLRSNLYRVALAIFASLALLENLGTLVYRLVFFKTGSKVGYDVFVTNLCVADFLMGVYLLIIGIADHRYRGVYVWEDIGWRKSGFCKLAGFVCFLSLEVSVLIIFLITSDRLLVLCFPFSTLHFTKRSANIACGLVWLAGLTFGITPLLPVTSHWQFYSQTSICIPLPTSRIDFPGRKYSFTVIVVFNFICFLLIFFGQVIIYGSIRSNSMSATSSCKATKDFTIARRLITVVMSDFLCWFPVGLAGILASYDVPVSGEVNVGIAIFVLPVNSALNPFLYTLNIYLERRRRAREEERRKRIIGQLKLANVYNANRNEKVNMTNNEAIELVRLLISTKILSLHDIKNNASRKKLEE